MSTVGIRELKNRLTYYLHQTRRGEEIVVTERGKPVALIQQLESAKKIKSPEARLAHLASRGFLILPSRKPLKKIRRLKVSGKPVSKIISEERR